MGFFGLNSFLACFHGRRVTVSLATSHRRVAVFWVELFLGLLSRQESYGFFGYFPQESCGSLSWPAFTTGELRFLWLLPTGELRFFGLNSFLACFHGRRVTVSLATSHRRV